jgi:putative chitinase
MESGEGWRYQGRGLVQTTGKANYTTEDKALRLDLVDHPELLELPEHAVNSAANFWKRKGLNTFGCE